VENNFATVTNNQEGKKLMLQFLSTEIGPMIFLFDFQLMKDEIRRIGEFIYSAKNQNRRIKSTFGKSEFYLQISILCRLPG